MASSLTASIGKEFEYDVFLSFRGEDVRKKFIDHLYDALERKGIRTYKDDERLEKGKRINDELLQSIENSKFYIIAFSKTYASSAWCLNELVKIMECNKMTGHTAFPIFYDVEPTEVRHQSGEVGKAFSIHNGKDDVVKWREALNEAGNLSGYVLKNTDDGHEAKFIKRIVEHIFLELRSINVYIDKKIVGMERRIEYILSYLENGTDEVRMIGIRGIGGGGKTTLARALFDKISTDFEGSSFVENIRESDYKFGLVSLQNQVIADVSNEKNIMVSSVHNGKNLMIRMLRGKKVLIVLDDVNHIEQLEALAGESNWFKAGSRIIITTRDEQVLIAHKVMSIHDVCLLSEEEAMCVFSRYAFGGDKPTDGYKELSLSAVCYAAGLPLMLKALGELLSGKDELEWKDQLERLKTIPMPKPLQILELSYISLENDFREIFLDIACFLNGSKKDDAIRILESCGFYAKIGLKILELKSLLTISSNQHLAMHNHLQDMGRYIVKRGYPDDPEKHSRLWEREKIEKMLAKLGNEETRAIAVDECLGPESVAQGFENIKRLRFLRMVSREDENIHHFIRNFPSTLRYLSWKFYPHLSLPRTFQADNLVALEMSDCKIQKLWEGGEKKALKQLKFLVLSHSNLTSLDLDLTPNLEKLDLQGCKYLETIHMVETCLQKLVSLNLTDCSRIDSLLFIKRLESLELLHLSGLSLEYFPDIIPGPDNNNFLELHFRDNNIDELPSSIGNLKKLVYLDLRYCINLRRLPGSICGLHLLKDLKLYRCSLEELPEDIGSLKCLTKLKLLSKSITHLPDSICMLKKLITLKLTHCISLEKLPNDLGQLDSLEKLILTDCPKIREIPDSICRLKGLKFLSLLKCIELEKLPEGLELLECWEVLKVKGTRIKLPQSILSLGTLKIDVASSSS